MSGPVLPSISCSGLLANMMRFNVAGNVRLTPAGRATLELQADPPEPGRAGPPGNRGTLAKPTAEEVKQLIEDKAVVLHDSRWPLWDNEIVQL